MGKRFYIVLFSIFYPFITYSQGEIDDQERIFFRNEKTIALMLNTTGLGLNLSYAKRLLDWNKKILYQIDFVEIKHPKEIKISLSSPLIEAGGSFVYGKLNKFFNLRTGIGKQKELYRKIDRGGVSIRNYFTGGIDIGLEKPVYYIVLEYQPSAYVRVERKFNTEPHASNYIERYASFFKGFNEIKIVPGLFAKYSFMFEYGKDDDIIHAIDGGIIIDVFARPVHLMAHNDNDFFFVSMYISYRFGKVVDSRFNYRKNKIDRLVSE